MATTLAIVSLQGASLLPRDLFVNTFHFRKDTALDADDRAAIASRLIEFYNTLNGGAATAVSSWIGAGVSRGANLSTIKQYDLADLKPRPIARTDMFTLGAAGNALGDYPSEVAVTISYFGSQNVKRRRGRIYIGPLLDDAGTLQPNVRVSSALRANFATAAARLRDQSNLAGVPWVVHSEAALQDFTITGGWVDNEFDTQRRRGLRADARTTF